PWCSATCWACRPTGPPRPRRLRRRRTGPRTSRATRPSEGTEPSQVRLEEPVWPAQACQEGLGGQVAAADGPFHGGRPAGGGPVAGDEQVGQRGSLGGSPAVDAGHGTEGGLVLGDDAGAQQVGRREGGKEPPQFLRDDALHFRMPEAAERPGGADDHLKVVFAGGDLAAV